VFNNYSSTASSYMVI